MIIINCNQIVKACVALFLVVYGLSVQANEGIKSLTIDDIGAAEIEYNVQTYKSSTEYLHTQEQYNKSRVAHQKELMEITETAYSTQQVITILIFIIVSILVLGGVWLSYLQFKADINKSQLSEDGKPKASFKIGKDGIEFSSSVIGLIVLFMSFFFFHLYVKDVYTIKTHNVAPLTLDSKTISNKQAEK